MLYAGGVEGSKKRGPKVKASLSFFSARTMIIPSERFRQGSGRGHHSAVESRISLHENCNVEPTDVMVSNARQRMFFCNRLEWCDRP